VIERVLFGILKAGLDWFIADPRRFERWLVTEKLLDAAEAVNMRVFFTGDATVDPPIEPKFPHLIHGYARTGGPFPCAALCLGAEDIATDYIGEDASFLDSDEELYRDPETGEVVDPKVRRMRYTYQLMLHAQHPDVVVVYYHLMKWILMSSRKQLIEANIEEMTFSGRDMAPDPRYLPDDIWTRMLTITVEGDETWEEPLEQYATRVTGIFGPPEDPASGLAVAGEKVLMTPVAP
jgi:hypothetical protein